MQFTGTVFYGYSGIRCQVLTEVAITGLHMMLIWVEAMRMMYEAVFKQAQSLLLLIPCI
jgi:hypothetical protein